MDDLAALEAAIYDQSFRALDEQARLVEAVRARAGALLPGASVATALLGGLAGASTSHGGMGSMSWVAIALYIGVIVLSLFVVSLRTNTAVAHHPNRLIRIYLNREPPASLREYRGAIAFYNGRSFDANARQLRMLAATFVVASVCLGCELVVWLWILAS